jgi:hypothetical protein
LPDAVVDGAVFAFVPDFFAGCALAESAALPIVSALLLVERLVDALPESAALRPEAAAFPAVSGLTLFADDTASISAATVAAAFFFVAVFALAEAAGIFFVVLFAAMMHSPEKDG